MLQMKYGKDVKFRRNFSHGDKDHGEKKRQGKSRKENQYLSDFWDHVRNIPWLI